MPRPKIVNVGSSSNFERQTLRSFFTQSAKAYRYGRIVPEASNVPVSREKQFSPKNLTHNFSWSHEEAKNCREFQKWRLINGSEFC